MTAFRQSNSMRLRPQRGCEVGHLSASFERHQSDMLILALRLKQRDKCGATIWIRIENSTA
jgi:hypothetical protein